MKLAPNSHNYLRISDIRRVDTDAAPSNITSVTAAVINGAGDTVADSSITLSAVSGDTDSYEGTFPPLEITRGTRYIVRVTYVADGATRVQDIDALCDAH